MKTRLLIGTLGLFGLAGCGGPLVGGECAPGYTADGETCVAAHQPRNASTGEGGTTSSSSSSGGAAETGGGGGESTSNSTGSSSSSTSSATGGGDGGSGTGGSLTSVSSTGSGAGGDATSSSTGGSTGTGFTCFPPLADCHGTCADLATDSENCGGCDVACDAGATCSNGVCGGPIEGDPRGRVIVIGMNFEGAKLGDAEAVLLGNAIFSAAHEPVRAVNYAQFATEGSAASAALTDLAVDEAIIRDRTLESWTMNDAPSVAAALASTDFDLLVVRDQDAGSAAALATAGATLAQPIAAFTARGGVVVVLATTAGQGQMASFLSAALGLGGSLAAISAPLTNAAPADALGLGVLATFASRAKTATLPNAFASGAALTSIIVDPRGKPVVIANP